MPAETKSNLETNRAKTVLVNTGVLLLAFIVSFSIAEVIVRALYGDETVLFPRYHTDVQYGAFSLRRIQPNADFLHKSVDGTWRFETNAQGFRNYQDFTYDKPVGMLRVLSLGDSQTQGYEVRQDHTYSAVMERYLESNVGQVEVINAGVSGFSTAESLLLLENEGRKYQPDFVVLGFYRNDITDNTRTKLFSLSENGELLVTNTSYVPGTKIQNVIYSLPGVQWLSEHSYFYSLLFNTTWSFVRTQLNNRNAAEALEIAVSMETSFSDYQLEISSKLVERLHHVCQEIGATLIIVDIPAFSSESSLETSVPPAIRDSMISSSDIYLDSAYLFSEYADAAQLHVPNGHRHISEFTHTIIGVEVAQQIENSIGNGVR